MISKLALSFGGVMIAIALCVSSTSAQDAQDNSQRLDPREATEANRPQRLGGEPRKQINPRQREAIKKMRERTENGPVPAGLERRKIQVGETEREYFINIPQSCQDKPSPVVFVLHGGATSSGIAMHLKADFTKLGASAGYNTVYPSGINGWNIGSHDMYSVQRRTSNADDVGFFRTMFDELIEKKIADPARIYLVGGSNGGVMTQYLVCNLADRIAAAGVMVATLPRAADTQWPKPTKPVPMMIALGTKDAFKPWNGNKDQMSAEGTAEFWRKLNGCVANSENWDLPDRDPKDGTTVHARQWKGNAPVLFYTMKGHGHGWPMQRGRGETGTGPKTQDINSPEEFWKFLKDKTR